MPDDRQSAPSDVPSGLTRALEFGLFDALTGRRSRRFAVGAEIPGGPFAYRSALPPQPLTELETVTVLASMAGSTGWHFLHPHSSRADPALPAYSIRPGGRTMASGAGWHTTELFFTDDTGTYLFETRDAGALVRPDAAGRIEPLGWIEAHRSRIRRLTDARLDIPADWYTPHNQWGAGRSGSLLVIPITDLAEMFLAGMAVGVARGVTIVDDRAGGAPLVDGSEWSNVLDTDIVWPLSVMEQEVLGFAAAEQAIACHNGMLALAAMGLGSWMFNGVDHVAVLGASGDPLRPGLGFRYDTDDRWPMPNVTGLPGVFEGACPPHLPSMTAAVERLHARRHTAGGAFDPDTGGPWRDNASIRGAGAVPDERARACLAAMAETIHARYGKFPASLSSIHVSLYLQAHHLDLDFYDRFFGPGAVLASHRDHQRDWH
jgi:hypothetical protein